MADDPTASPAEPPTEPAGAADEGASPAGPGLPPNSELSEALGRLVKVALDRGRQGMVRATDEGRVRLEQRQLKKDLDVMYRKLGREVMRLVESGDIAHPGLVRGVARIQAVEERIAAMRSPAPTGGSR